MTMTTRSRARTAAALAEEAGAVQIVQSQTLAKVGHPTCTFTCKGGTSWCWPKECKTRSGRSTENFIEACKASTGQWMLPL